MTDEEAYRVWEKAREELLLRSLEYRYARALAIQNAQEILRGEGSADDDGERAGGDQD